MKTGIRVTKYIDLSKRVIERVEQIQYEVANKVKEDVVNMAPKDTGTYASTIKVADTVNKDKVIRTKIYTDYMTPTNHPKWSKVPLGCLLEWGTGIKGKDSNEFPHGFPYRETAWTYFDKKKGTWVRTTGMVARPHFQPALLMNKRYYEEAIAKAIQEAYYG